MRKTIVTAVAAFLLGSATTGALIARAQQAPPMQPPMAGVSPTDRATGQGPWGERMRQRQAQRMEMMRAFALVPRAEDRRLSPPDVQKIAEAFLLWNGNHSWKVINVRPDGDAIGFDMATAEGSVIAHFTMDPKTARLARKS
jgi:hypothetical protein